MILKPKLQIGLGAAGFAAAVLVAGCSEFRTPAEPPPPVGLGGYPTWTLRQSPDQIALRWYPDATPIVATNEAARLHCRSWGRTAELISDTRDGSAEIAEYRCR
jgi:hypothetical protein